MKKISFRRHLSKNNIINKVAKEIKRLYDMFKKQTRHRDELISKIDILTYYISAYVFSLYYFFSSLCKERKLCQACFLVDTCKKRPCRKRMEHDVSRWITNQILFSSSAQLSPLLHLFLISMKENIILHLKRAYYKYEKPNTDIFSYKSTFSFLCAALFRIIV